MTATHVDIFLASLKRCLAIPDFLKNFYDIFMNSSEEVREKFRNTDFAHQTRVLEESLFVLAVVAQGHPNSPAWSELPRLAARHSRADLDIRPGLYDLWLDCLLQAVRNHDPDFSPEVEKAWRDTLAVGIAYLRAHH